MGWQWQQLDHMQIICTSLQTDNHVRTSPLSFYRPDALPAAQPTVPKHWKVEILNHAVSLQNWQDIHMSQILNFGAPTCRPFTNQGETCHTTVNPWCALLCHISRWAANLVAPAVWETASWTRFWILGLPYPSHHWSGRNLAWKREPAMCSSVPHFTLIGALRHVWGAKNVIFNRIYKFVILWWCHFAAQRQSWTHVHNFKLSRIQWC